MEFMNFLTRLQENNSLDWMHAHDKEYREALKGFEVLLQSLINELAVEEPELALLRPKELMFRLNRDTRFGADKSPYNPSFRAHISPGGKAPIPVGYFLSLKPGDSFVGGGLFVPPGLNEPIDRVRAAILERGSEFDAIVRKPEFAKYFTLSGTKLKNVPRGYPTDGPWGEYLKYKSWEIEYHLPQEAMANETVFRDTALKLFSVMKPFHDWLNGALGGYRLPERK